MSKRFGRNQKRKLREEVANAEQKRDMWKKYHDEAKMVGARNARIVEETARVLGKHFLTLDPQNVVVRELDDIRRDWRVLFMSRRLRTPMVNKIPLNDFLEHMVLPILRYSDSCDEIHNRQHFRFYYDGEQVGYAIDREALMNMPDDMAVEYLAREMAQFLYQSLSKRKAA